ncbi:MAG: site-specific integrase [Acidobacteriota bacterium]|nr:site-specific integrase [Acidobacteriota bacterium]
MDQCVNHLQTLLHICEGPLGCYLHLFAQQLTEQGYARYSVHLKLRLVAHFSHWLAQQGVTLHDLTPEHAQLYLQHRAHPSSTRKGDAAALSTLFDLLRHQQLIAATPAAPLITTPVKRLADEFALYLRQERALAPTTVTNYLEFVTRFLTAKFADGEVALSVLCAADVVAFVQRQAACLHLKRAKLMTTALRSFLQYARYRGDISIDLVAAVPTVANWSMASIPRSLPPVQVELVLAHCNRQTPLGRRDYAILLLLARLGLRAGEVAALRLEDINWQAGCISVRGKGSQWSPLPLPADVGEAIAAYLQDGRPPTTSRSVFVRGRAPAISFRNQLAVLSVVRHALARAGIDAPHKGAHQFRHTLATELLRHGASLSEIGEVLRHRSPQTTAIYAKVDLAALRTLALPWPGGAR